MPKRNKRNRRRNNKAVFRKFAALTAAATLFAAPLMPAATVFAETAAVVTEGEEPEVTQEGFQGTGNVTVPEGTTVINDVAITNQDDTDTSDWVFHEDWTSELYEYDEEQEFVPTDGAITVELSGSFDAATITLSEVLPAGEYQIVATTTDADEMTYTVIINLTVTAPESELPNLSVTATATLADGTQMTGADGDMVGTTGESMSMEQLDLSLVSEDESLMTGITLEGHIQDTGWVEATTAEDGQLQVGQVGARLEAIRLTLSDELAENFDIQYRVHSQSYGWLDWATNGEVAGTTGMSKRGEAVQIRLVAKDMMPAGDDSELIIVDRPGVHSVELPVSASIGAHLQGTGDITTAGSFGTIIGTTGQSRRLEQLTFNGITHAINGVGDTDLSTLRVRAHLQNIGWNTEAITPNADGTVSVGTTGESRRLEAISIELPEEMKGLYTVHYRVHVQDIGWMGWATNGAPAGTTGRSLRIEAIQVVVTPIGVGAPGATANAFNGVPAPSLVTPAPEE